MKSIVEKVKCYVKKECGKPEACFRGAYENHFVPVVKYALQLAEKQKADKEVVEIAAWLHDIGSIKGYYENHHIVSAKIAEQLLKNLNYPRNKIEQVKHCILAHRARFPMKKETKEAQILADADAMSHFDDIPGLTKVWGSKEIVFKKLERSYIKLSKNARLLVKSKFERAKQELK